MLLPDRRLVAAVLTFALLSTPVVAAPAGAQDDAAVFSESDLEQFGVPLDELRTIEPNRSWDGLGLFSDDALRLLAAVAGEIDVAPYAFGDDLSTPPVISPSGALAESFGVMQWRLPDDWTAPAHGLTDSMAFAQTPGLTGGMDITLIWTQFDSDFDFSSGVTLNEGVTVAIPGLPIWESTFEGDTWEGSSLMPTADFVDGTLAFEVFSFQPPQSFPAVDMPAFYYRSGDIMAIALSSDALVAMADAAAISNTSNNDEVAGQTQNLLYTGDGELTNTQNPNPLVAMAFGLQLHMTGLELFTPGFVIRMIAFITLISIFVAITTAIFPTPPVAITPSTAAPTTEAPTDTLAPSDPPAVNPGVEDGGSNTVLILVLVILIFVGISVFFGRRFFGGGTRVRGGEDEEEEEDDGEDVRDAPAPVIYGEEIDESGQHWAAVYFDATNDHGRSTGKKTTLHPAPNTPIYTPECARYEIAVVTLIIADTGAVNDPKKTWSRRFVDRAWSLGDETIERGLTAVAGWLGADEKTVDFNAEWVRHDSLVKSQGWGSGLGVGNWIDIKDDDGFKAPRTDTTEEQMQATADQMLLKGPKRADGHNIEDLDKSQEKDIRPAEVEYKAKKLTHEETKIFVRLISSGAGACDPLSTHVFELNCDSYISGSMEISCADHSSGCGHSMKLNAGIEAEVESNVDNCTYKVVKPDYTSIDLKGESAGVNTTFTTPKLEFSLGIEQDLKVGGVKIGKAGASLGGVSFTPKFADDHNAKVELPQLRDGRSGRTNTDEIKVRASTEMLTEAAVKTDTNEELDVAVDVEAKVRTYSSHSFKVVGASVSPKCPDCAPSIEIVLGSKFNPIGGGFDDDHDGMIKVGGKTYFLKRPEKNKGKKIINWELSS